MLCVTHHVTAKPDCGLADSKHKTHAKEKIHTPKLYRSYDSRMISTVSASLEMSNVSSGIFKLKLKPVDGFTGGM